MANGIRAIYAACERAIDGGVWADAHITGVLSAYRCSRIPPFNGITYGADMYEHISITYLYNQTTFLSRDMEVNNPLQTLQNLAECYNVNAEARQTELRHIAESH